METSPLFLGHEPSNPPVEAMTYDSDLKLKAGMRSLLAAPFWAARIVVGWGEAAWWSVPTLDGALVLLHVWAAAPIQKLQGNEFPSPNRLSSNVVTPLLIALFLLVRDAIEVFP